MAVPWIIANGPAAFAAIGAPEAPGTVLVQVSGAKRNGIAEVPTGTPLKDILAMAGGGAAGHTVKAVLVRGASGGRLPASAPDTPFTVGPPRPSGRPRGSGPVRAAPRR